MGKMKSSLSGQVAVVTGASGPIGKAIALLLSSYGVSLVLVGRNERALGEVVGEVVYGGGKARHVVGDVRELPTLTAAVGRALETFGGLDIAIAAAQTSGTTTLGVDGASEQARWIVETNLLGAIHTFDAAIRVMREGGRLIAISSALGKIGAPGYAAYCASKAGMQGLVRAVAREVAPRRMTCNAICPGWVDPTGTGDGVGAPALPEHVATLVAFLASADAAGMTGQEFSIGGKR
jgi:3-oxoacyl-[acyl-carrier protein] reductase